MLKKFKMIICHSEYFDYAQYKRSEESLTLCEKYLKQVQRSFVTSFLRMTVFLLLVTCYLLLVTSVYADHCLADEAHTDFGCISNDPFKFATSIYGIGLGLIGVVGLLSIIYGAFLVLSSQGDPVKLQNGKSYIVYALIGMALAVGGFAFYRIIAANVIKLPGFS